MMTLRRSPIVPLLVLLAATASGCASRVSHDAIVRANGRLGQADGATDPSTSAAQGVSGTDGGQVAGSAGGTGNPTIGGAAGGPGPGGAGSIGSTGSGGLRNGSTGTTGAPSSRTPIVLGSSMSISGLGTAGIEQARQVLLAWAADLNARGGIKGHPVRIIVKDDGGDASKARAQVQELVEKDKVVALIGNLNYTASTDAWQGYLEQKKVPAIGGNCAAKAWNSSPVFFSQCPAPDTYLYGAVHLAATFGSAKKFGAMVCVEDSVCSSATTAWFDKGYAKKAGLDPVYRADISLAQPDFTAQCLQAQSAGVQVLGLMVDPATVKRIMSSCTQQGFRPQYLLTWGEEVADTVNFANDIISAQLDLPFFNLDTPAYQSFHSMWRKYSTASPTPNIVTAWVSAKIFERAATDAKSLTSAGLIEALYKYRNETFGNISVPLTYGPRGTTNSPCVFYMRGTNGRWSTPQADKAVCW